MYDDERLKKTPIYDEIDSDSADEMMRGSHIKLCVLSDWVCMCRLLGCHTWEKTTLRSLCVNKPHSIMVDGRWHFQLVSYVTLRCNVNLLVAEESIDQYIKRLKEDLEKMGLTSTQIELHLRRQLLFKKNEVPEGVGASCTTNPRETPQPNGRVLCGPDGRLIGHGDDDSDGCFGGLPSCCAKEGIHTIFAANWFSPKGITDYLYLGLPLIWQQTFDPKYNMMGCQFAALAEEFLWSPNFMNYLNTRSIKGDDFRCHKLCGKDCVQNKAHSKSPVKIITTTGFSIGGAIAFCLAYLIRETKLISTPLRAVSFGAPRVGGSKFWGWYGSAVEIGSCAIVLASTDEDGRVWTDPATYHPALADGFQAPPVCFVLTKDTDKGGARLSLYDHDSHFNFEFESGGPIASMLALLPYYNQTRDRYWTELHGVSIYYQALLAAL